MVVSSRCGHFNSISFCERVGGESRVCFPHSTTVFGCLFCPNRPSSREFRRRDSSACNRRDSPCPSSSAVATDVDSRSSCTDRWSRFTLALSHCSEIAFRETSVSTALLLFAEALRVASAFQSVQGSQLDMPACL